MDFFAVCLDKPDHLQLRMATRDAHLAYLQEHDSTVKGAGPILSEDQSSVIGSLLLIRAEDMQTAMEYLANDPYMQAGLFASTLLRPWRWLVKPAP